MARSAWTAGFRSRAGRAASVLLALALGLVFVSPGALARGSSHGALKQLEGASGCVSETGSAGACADGKALDGASFVAVSADGKNAYVASYDSDAVAAFARNTTTGALSQLAAAAGCVSETGSAGACADGKALDGPRSVAVSADGKNAYVVSYDSDAIAVFARSPITGKLGQLAGTAGCVSETGSGPCADGKALNGPTSVAVSADGKHVYVASADSDAVAIFSRHLPTGQLRQLVGAATVAGCVSETGSGPCADGKALDGPQSVAVSADDKHVYVASWDSDAVAVFARNQVTGSLTQLAGNDGCVSETGSGPCADGKALNGARSVAASADGKNVYATSGAGTNDNSNAVIVFARNPVTGKLTQLAGTDGCVSQTGSSGACVDGKALYGMGRVAVSADGKNVYTDAWGVAVFERGSAAGKLTQLAGTEGCVSAGGTENPMGGSGTCAAGNGIGSSTSVAVSADGKNVYTTASVSSDAVAVFTRHL